MGSDWVSLGEVCEIRRGSSPRPIVNFLSETSGMPWVKIADATGNNSRYITSTSQFIKNEGVCKSVIVKKGDLILSNSGTAGLPKFMGITACIHDGWQVLKELDGITSDYLYYSLIYIRPNLLHNAYDSVMKNLTLDMVRDAKIRLPPLQEQKAIAHILGSLDDKIELNRQINETLEAMAQALFKSWFVDFDPVIDNAIKAGNPIPDELLERAEQRQAMQNSNSDNQTIRALFPDAFEFTEEMGWIPKGWESVLLGDFAILGNGKTSPDRAVGDIPVFGSNGKIGDCDESNRDDTIIIGRVGSYCGSLQYYPSKCWITDNAMSAEMQNKNNNIFLFQLLSRDNLNDRRTGSGQPLLNQSILRSIKTIYPSIVLIEEYSRIANDLYRKIDQLNKDNITLAKLRDTLLPKLLSGELRITDAAAMVEDA